MARRGKSEEERRIDVMIGCRIESARKRKKLKPGQLARKLGVSYTRVYNWETGKSGCTVAQLSRVARVLGIETRELMPSLHKIQDPLAGAEISAKV